MSEGMNLSINGQSQVPPGFRFHPTEEELLHYYLRKKVAQEKIDLDVIREVDLNKLEPWDIQEKCRIGSTPQSDWYFFSHKDKKYPTGTRTNRATAEGFWKATGRDKIIYSGFRRIGLRKTLVFYRGRAPHGQKSDWIMHEYRLDETTNVDSDALNPGADQSAPEEGWVVCRVFRKKNMQKTPDQSPRSSSSTSSMDSKILHTLNSTATTNSSTVLDQILLYVGGGGGRMSNSGTICKTETGGPILSGLISSDGCTNPMKANHAAMITAAGLHERFMHLPRLESPTVPLIPSPFDHHPHHHQFEEMISETDGTEHDHVANASDWAAFDRLVACQLNGQAETSGGSVFGGIQLSDELDETVQMQQLSKNIRGTNNRTNHHQIMQNYNTAGEDEFWSFTKSSSSTPSPLPSDPLRHLSV